MICLSKATDEQLKNIVKYDIDCPAHLLSGVVMEMLNRELFSGLIHKTIQRKFRNINIACGILDLSKDDLYQVGNMTIWESLKRYEVGRSSFTYFTFLNILSELKNLEEKVKAEKRKVYEGIQSIDKTRNEKGESFKEILPSDKSVEMYVINKISWEERISVLTEEEKRTLHFYLEGFSFSEIAIKEDVSKAGIGRRIKNALYKLIGRNLNLSELGIRNFKRGKTA